MIHWISFNFIVNENSGWNQKFTQAFPGKHFWFLQGFLSESLPSTFLNTGTIVSTFEAMDDISAFEDMEPKPETSRIVLSASHAIEIYQSKLKLLQPNASDPCIKSEIMKIRGQSGPVAKCFGVSPKTVRDIWNRRTWAHTTYDLWSDGTGLCSSMAVRYLSLLFNAIF